MSLRHLLRVLPLAPTFLPARALTAIKRQRKCIMYRPALSCWLRAAPTSAFPPGCRQKGISSCLGLPAPSMPPDQPFGQSLGERGASTPRGSQAPHGSPTPRFLHPPPTPRRSPCMHTVARRGRSEVVGEMGGVFLPQGKRLHHLVF